MGGIADARSYCILDCCLTLGHALFEFGVTLLLRQVHPWLRSSRGIKAQKALRENARIFVITLHK